MPEMAGRPATRRFRRTGIRGPRPLEELEGPDFTYPNPPGTWREIRPGDVDPARAAWIAKVFADPQAARRERLEAKRLYWRARVQRLEARLELVEQTLAHALHPAPDDDGAPSSPLPAVELFRLRADCGAAWADVQAARARLAEVERELAKVEAQS